MKRKSRSSSPRDTFSAPPKDKSSASLPSMFNPLSIAIFAAIFILGIGLGLYLSSAASVNPQNVVTREAIDRSAPDPELCAQYGASAMVTDMRVFVTLNPLSVYVTQPNIRPGCVLRRNNWAIVEQKKLVTSDQVRECKDRLNTFGYTGKLESNPEITCVYQNENAGNLFFNQPGTVGPKPETDRF